MEEYDTSTWRSNLISFLIGVGLTVVFYLWLPTEVNTEFESKSKFYDSLITEQNIYIDSILLINEELEIEKNKIDTFEKKVYINLNNDIQDVYKNNDSDSLVKLIKSAIYDQRTAID